MNAAMEYLLGRVRAIEALRPEFEAGVEQMRELGLARIAEVLTPLFADASEISGALSDIRDQWATDLLPEAVRADAVVAVTAEFADYRMLYLGALSEPVAAMADGSPVPVGTLYFDTTLNGMQVMGAEGWKSTGGIITSIMEPLNFVAAAGQTSFVVPGGYDVGFLVLALNGFLLAGDQFDASDGANIVVSAPLVAGDVLSGYSFGSITIASVYSKGQADARYRLVADTYSKGDVDGIVSSKANIVDVYTKSAVNLTFLSKGGNLSELTDTSASRANLGLGGAATKAADYYAVATATYTKVEADARYAVAAETLSLTTGDDRYILAANAYDKTASDGRYLQKSDNLAGLADKPAARGNLGLGSVATLAQTAVMRLGVGAAGITLYAGTGAPANTLGADGDIYVQG